MYSIIWNFIVTRRNRFSRFLVFLLLTVASMLFSIPRYKEGWFFYSLIVYPVLILTILELTKRVLRFLSRIRENCIALVKNKDEQQMMENWWINLGKREHLVWCFAIALFLASLSLVFNANPAWSRYTDAAGILYVGFFAGEIAYLLLLVPSGIVQLRKYTLRFNPIFPAHTVNLQILAESCFVLALGIGISLLMLNLVIATASILFPHLLFGIIFVSVLSWIAIIGLSIYPHFILFELAQREKRKTLGLLEKKLMEQYNYILDNKKATSSIDEILKLHEQVSGSKSYTLSNSATFSLAATMFLNVTPVILGLFAK